MNNCDAVRDLLILFAEQELSPEEHRGVQEHLAQCEACRRELAGIESIRSALSDPDLFLPSDYAWQSLPRALAARARDMTPVRRWVPSNLGSLGWAASLAASVLLAAGLIQVIKQRHSVSPPTISHSQLPPGNEPFLRRMESIYARDATARYLNECQDLLLNLVRVEQSCDRGGHDVSAEVARARELLQQKRMLDAELKTPEVARAKELCDQLENVLVDLSISDHCESSDKLRIMQRTIRKEQLLLRINLLKSELS
jgi:hypothetical protein